MNSIEIIFEDQTFLIIDKPSGITVNIADTTRNEQTIQDWVIAKYNLKKPINNKSINESEFNNRSGIVHRLDKETSGVLIIAKNEDAFINLQNQFKERLTEKTYVALAHGKVNPESGQISVPVGRLPWNRKRFGVLAGGKDAFTEYLVNRYYNLQLNKNKNEELSLLELYPKTGRTHQLRVHLKYLNHPIYSDPIYAGRKTSRNDRKILPRIFLHARKICFTHPVTLEKVCFESQLPMQLSDFLKNLNPLS